MHNYMSAHVHNAATESLLLFPQLISCLLHYYRNNDASLPSIMVNNVIV